MGYLELFQRVIDHVAGMGLKVTFRRGKRLSPAVIKRAQDEALIAIPPSMAAFYAEVGDGMSLRWTGKGADAPFANHAFPKLADITFRSLDQINWRMEWNDSCDFQSTKDPTLAKRTAMRMRSWIPFHDEGNGDCFCLETAVEGTPVVFNQHDWFDGGSGENGHVLARSLAEFYEAWANVCFQFPRTPWWPKVFNPSGGVHWDSDEFQEPFQLCLA